MQPAHFYYTSLYACTAVFVLPGSGSILMSNLDPSTYATDCPGIAATSAVRLADTECCTC